MPFIPHTEDDIQSMLKAVGADSIDRLFDEIDPALRCSGLDGVPPALSEMEITRLMHERAAQDGAPVCFLGAGAYEHHVPAAVWEITARGEFYSAYTPYQAEASQGSLQLMYEYQSMMASLTGMDVSNASLYDGASALAEAILMAVRAHRKSKSRRILMPANLHPAYRRVASALVEAQGIELIELPFSGETGTTLLDALKPYEDEDITALVISQPSFFGTLEDVDSLTRWAEARGALSIAVVNPVSLAVMRPPGDWGDNGADIVCGEGQPLGAPLSSGGPYFGFLCCRQSLVRQLPGRIAGRTVDLDGRVGYTLTLQAREQHIRRSKATSNICTNQGLLVTAATIYMALLGPRGLAAVADACLQKREQLVTALSAIDGVELLFTAPVFHEAVLRLPRPAGEVLGALSDRNILGGYDLSEHYPELGDAILVCATETRTDADIEYYAAALREVLSKPGSAVA